MFDVRLSYQIQENLTALKLLLPLFFFHLIIFSGFNLCYALIGYFFVRTNGINSKTAYSFAYVSFSPQLKSHSDTVCELWPELCLLKIS